MKTQSLRVAAMTALLALALAAPSANALSLDARINRVLPAGSLTPIAEATPNAQGDVFGYQLNVGERIRVDIVAANPEQDPISSILATLIYPGHKLDYVSTDPHISILKAPGFFEPGLDPIEGVVGEVKANSPNNPGEAGDVWIQALAFGEVGELGPATGTGPETIASVWFDVTDASSGFVSFDLGLTSGDSIVGASTVTFDGALVTAVPEPGTALLLGLGLMGLSTRSRG